MVDTIIVGFVIAVLMWLLKILTDFSWYRILIISIIAILVGMMIANVTLPAKAQEKPPQETQQRLSMAESQRILVAGLSVFYTATERCSVNYEDAMQRTLGMLKVYGVTVGQAKKIQNQYRYYEKLTAMPVGQLCAIAYKMYSQLPNVEKDIPGTKSH